MFTGSSLESCSAGKEACQRWYDDKCNVYKDELKVYHTVGIHPHDAKKAFKDGKVDGAVIDELGRLASHPFVVSMGECGLDYDRMFSPMQVQLTVFEAQVQLAHALKKPLFIHLRERDSGKGSPLGNMCFQCFLSEEL